MQTQCTLSKHRKAIVLEGHTRQEFIINSTFECIISQKKNNKYCTDQIQTI